MGRLGSGGWSGDGGVRVGAGRDGIGFEGYQVRGLGSGRSKELGGWGWRSSGQEVELKSRRLVGLGSEVGLREVGVGGVGELGLGELVGIRRVGVKRVEGGLKWGRRGSSWVGRCWGRKGWSWVRRGSNQGLKSRWSEELGGWGRRSLGQGVGLGSGRSKGLGDEELGSGGLGLGKLGSGE